MLFLLNGFQATHRSTKYWSFCLQFGNDLGIYWFIIFLPIGFISNILSFLVMSRKHNRKLSTCVYMSIIAVSDNCVLCSSFHGWLWTNFDIHHHTPWICKVKIFISRLFGTFAAYEIVLMTLDRAIAVALPHKAKSMCSANKAKLWSLLNFIFSTWK